MEKTDVYKKSLSLLRKLVAETPKEELLEMVKSAKYLNIQGPTYAEYLDAIQTTYSNIN